MKCAAKCLFDSQSVVRTRRYTQCPAVPLKSLKIPFAGVSTREQDQIWYRSVIAAWVIGSRSWSPEVAPAWILSGRSFPYVLISIKEKIYARHRLPTLSSKTTKYRILFDKMASSQPRPSLQLPEVVEAITVELATQKSASNRLRNSS